MKAVRTVLAAALVAATAGGCAAAPEAPEAGMMIAQTESRAAVQVPLRNAGFEADPVPGRACPASWWCTMHNDPASFSFALETDQVSRGRFLRVTRVKAEPWALVSQAIPGGGLAGKRLRVSVAVNAEELDGGAGPMIIVQGAGGRVLDHRKVLLERAPGWRRASAEMNVPTGAELVEINLILEGGGRVGFDDVEATVLAPAGP